MKFKQFTAFFVVLAIFVSTSSVSFGRFRGLSQRAHSDHAHPIILGGIVDNGNIRLLIRGTGATLGKTYGVTNSMNDGMLLDVWDMSQGHTPTCVWIQDTTNGFNPAANGGLGSSPVPYDPVAMNALYTQVGLSLPTVPKDAGLVYTALFGGTTVLTGGDQVTSSGVALSEIFDLDFMEYTQTQAIQQGEIYPNAYVRLINMSARVLVTTKADEVAITGVIVDRDGYSEKLNSQGQPVYRFLVRVNGPQLAKEGVKDPLSHPTLTMYDGQKAVAYNDGWQNGPTNVADGYTVEPVTDAQNGYMGSVPFAAGSNDCAFIVTVPAGGYTFIVRSKDGTIGEVVTEVFEM